MTPPPGDGQIPESGSGTFDDNVMNRRGVPPLPSPPLPAGAGAGSRRGARRSPATGSAALPAKASSMLAIIGGSGLTRLSTLAVAHREVVRTPYGEPSSALLFGQIAGRDAVFLARHGHGHTIPPHRVNYRANLWALQGAGRARRSLAVASVGGIRDCAPGRARAAAPAHRLHATAARRRSSTAATGASSTSTSPIRTRRRCAQRASRRRAAAGIALTDGGVYGAVNGPAARDRRRDRPDGARRRDAGRHDRHARGRARARARAAVRGDRVVVNHAAGRGDSRERDLDGRHRAGARSRRWTRCARCSTTSRR